MMQKSGVDYDKEFVDNFDYDNLWDEDLLDNFLPKALKGKNPYAELSKMVQSAGFDGIQAGDEIVVFEPNQIKSITNTNPTSSGNINENRKGMKENMDITNVHTGAVDINKFTFTNYRNPDGQSHPKCKTYRSTLEYMASETERLFNSCLKNYWGETKPYDQLTIEYMNLNRHSCTRDIVGAGSEEGLKDARDAILKRQGELLEKAKEYTKWDFKTRQWVKETRVNEDTNRDITNEVQQAVDNIMKNKSKYRTQGDLEDAIYSVVANCFSGLHGVTRDTADMIADVYEKELKRVGLSESYVTTDDGIVTQEDDDRFTVTAWKGNRILYSGNSFEDAVRVYKKSEDSGEYCSFNDKAGRYQQDRVNKMVDYLSMNESNELEQRAKKHKKKSKGNGWHMSVNAGDVEKGIEVFNNSTSVGSGEGTAMGESLVDDEPHICDKCGIRLTDSGECPVCDYGEEDMFGESFSPKEAIFRLKDLD